MESLEKYIRNSRESFDEKEPMEGHFDRFRAKMEARKPARKVNLIMVAAAAAIAGLILTGTLGILYNNSSISKYSKKELSLSTISPELKEVESYYIEQINQRYSQIITLVKTATPEIKSEAYKTISDMNVGYKLLKKELNTNPNPEVVNAMIQQYQTQVDMLDQILGMLQSTSKTISQ